MPALARFEHRGLGEPGEPHPLGGELGRAPHVGGVIGLRRDRGDRDPVLQLGFARLVEVDANAQPPGAEHDREVRRQDRHAGTSRFVQTWVAIAAAASPMSHAATACCVSLPAISGCELLWPVMYAVGFT